MIRVVLIDDEPIIVEGLSRVVKWADYGCEVVGTADGSFSGAELIRKEKPDLVFMDICMPDGDGLNMLAGLRSEFPNLLVTILSGFSEFSYAQEAIRLGVVRYLVKPTKMNEINEALKFMAERVRENKTVEAEAGEEEDTPIPGSFIARQAMDYMEQHYAEKLTLQNVADYCYVSPWHLSKLLNRYGQKSFYDILNSIRIQKAKELLNNPGYRIGEISEKVGYTDTAHFSRVFKKMEGVSANEYRNRRH